MCDLPRRQRVHDDPRRHQDEGITFGSTDDPAVAKYAEQWAGEQVTTGDQARAFAQIMRYHTINAEWNPEHLTYAKVSRYLAADDSWNPAGRATRTRRSRTRPLARLERFRNQWVTELGLSTVFNMSFMAERLSVLGLVVGIALLLTGDGLLVLVRCVRRVPATESARTAATTRRVAW